MKLACYLIFTDPTFSVYFCHHQKAPCLFCTQRGLDNTGNRWFLQRKEQTGCNSKTPGWVRKDNYKHCMQQSGEERPLHFSESSDWWPGNSNKETYQERTDSSLLRSVLYEAAGYKQWEGISYEQSALCTGSGTPHRAELRRAGLTLHGVTNFSEILHMPFK